VLNSSEAKLGLPEATKHLRPIQSGDVPKVHGAYFIPRNHTASTSLLLPSLGFEDNGVKPSLAIDSQYTVEQVVFRYFALDGQDPSSSALIAILCT